VLNLRRYGRGDGYVRTTVHLINSIWQLYGAIRRTRPQIVHGVLFWAYVLGTYAARAARVPVVVASRRSLGLFKAHKPVYLFLERLADRWTDLFVANSDAVRIDTIERENIDPERIVVVRNGIDLSRFTGDEPVAAGDLGGRPRVIVVSNLIHYKGHEFFLRAWPAVRARFPSATALLVGDGPMREQLEMIARDLGIGESVRFLGTRQDVPALLARVDLCVHPSLQEGYSNAILEAMAAGCPVVATRVGGNVEAIVDGETGILVQSENADALAGGMLRLLSDPALAAELGSRAAAVIRRSFDIHAVVAAYENIYARLAAGESVRYDSESSRWSSQIEKR
jgi:glycosyltransferase involved in cell wall biosynthesis